MATGDLSRVVNNKGYLTDKALILSCLLVIVRKFQIEANAFFP